MAKARTRIAAFAAASLILAAGVTWYVASPAWTLRQMKAAAEASDPNALDAYIDYPALRDSLKAAIVDQMAVEAHKDRSGFGGIGLAIGTALAGPLIDGLVTPANMRAALTARHDGADHTSLQMRAAGAGSVLHIPDDPVIVRRGLSEFLVSTRRHPSSGLVFRRHGLSWKLSGVALPPSPESQPGS